MTYLIILVVILFSVIVFDFNKIENFKPLFYNLIFILFTALVALRYKLGGDTFNYMRDFEEFPRLESLTSDFIFGFRYAPLWVLFFSACKSLLTSFIQFQLIHALLVNGVIFWFIKKYSKFPFLSILVYYLYFYLYFNTEILRESLAICIFLIAYPFLEKRKYIYFYLLSFIAILFHYSASFLLIFPFLANLKLSFTYLFFSLIILIVLPALLIGFTPVIIQEYYNEYILYKPSLGGYLYSITIFLLFPLLCIYLFKFQHGNVFDIIKPVFFFISIYTLLSPSIALRLFNYILPLSTIYFSHLIGNYLLKDFKNKMVSAFLVIVVITYKFSSYIEDTSSIVYQSRFYIRWYPYTSILTINNLEDRKIISGRERWLDIHYSEMIENLNELE